VAEWVLAIGNPYQLSETVTLGIVSALNRQNVGINAYEDFIQTDAAINVGDSGGALLDLRGNVVGITTVVLEHDGTNTSIGFAIPSNLARAVMTQLIAHGDVRRGQIGVQAKDAADARAGQLRRLGLPAGAELVAVHPGSTADRAGLRTGDTVTALEGAPVRDAPDFRNKLALVREGSRAAVEFLRDGQLVSAQVTLAPTVPKVLDGRDLNAALAGVVFRVSEPMIAGEIPDIEAGSVVEGSEAWRGGLREGDIIISLNRNAVKDPEIFSEQLRQNPEHVYLGLLRKGRTMIALIR
jgi:S1-C subfamily serine protease